MNKEKLLLMPNLLALAIILLSTAPAPSAGDQSFCGDATYKRNGTYMSNLSVDTNLRQHTRMR